MKFTDKILFVTSIFPARTETFIVNQITNLIDLGFDVQIFSNFPKRTYYTDLNPEILKYKLVEKTFYNSLYKPNNIFKKYLKLLLFLFLNFRKIQWKVFFKCFPVFTLAKDALNLHVFYDSIYFLLHKMPAIIHIHFGQNATRFARLKKWKVIPKHVKLIVTFHGHDLVPNKAADYQKEYALVFKHAAKFTVNSVYLKNVLTAVNPLLHNVVIVPVIPNLKLFNSTFPTARKPTNLLHIVYCGRLIPIKGGDLVIEIANELKQRKLNFKIHILGEGELKEKMILQSKMYSLEKHIQFYGAVSQEIVKNVFLKSHIMLLTSIEDVVTKRAETQGLVIQEAQAMGLPVLVSDVGGMQYGMIENETGYVLPQKDIGAFVEKIIYLENNEALRYTMGENGIKYVQTNFNEVYLTKILIEKVYA